MYDIKLSSILAHHFKTFTGGWIVVEVGILQLLMTEQLLTKKKMTEQLDTIIFYHHCRN